MKVAAAEASDRNERESLQNRVALIQNEDNTEEALTSAAQTEKSTESQKKGGLNPVSTRQRPDETPRDNTERADRQTKSGNEKSRALGGS
jgi:hypothetical protein